MKKNGTPSTLREIYNKSALGIAEATIKDLWKRNRTLIYIDIGLTATLSSTLSGYMYLMTAGREYESTLLNAAVFGIIKVPWLTAIAFTVVNKFTYQILSALHKETVNDTERNYAASNEGYNGTAHKMTAEEKEATFSCGNYLEQMDNILGCEPGHKDQLYALRKDLYGKNGNVCIVGAPGCGKSRCLAIPIIMQTIRRGESLIITDPKGELYRDTAAIAKAHGYVVKILNFRPSQSLHTDTCDYMSVIGQSPFKSQSFSKTVIDNTSDGKKPDFWTESEFNLYMGICIWINTNDIGVEATMGGIYEFMCSHTLNEFEYVCSGLEPTHPAMPYLKTFTNGDKTVKGNTYAGLQIRLSALADPLVQKIVGTPDIDFTLPGKQKCIYYIGSPDTDKSRSYLVALFFTLLYNELIDFADEQESGHLPIRVTMLLDEFKNIGVIPAFPEKLSTVRSRWIDTIIILQGIEQLMSMYPDNEWETIMNDCTTRILINTNNNINADYFSKLSGEQTTEEKSIRYEESAGDLFKIHPTYTVTQTHGSRPVYTSNEILQLDPGHMLVFISQTPVVELEKLDYSSHPMCKEIRKWVPRYHAPQWILNMNEEDRHKFGVYKDKFRPETIDDIELCTEEDFMEFWSEKKQEELEKYIAYYKKNGKKPPRKKKNIPIPKDVFSINNELDAEPELELKDTISSFGSNSSTREKVVNATRSKTFSNEPVQKEPSSCVQPTDHGQDRTLETDSMVESVKSKSDAHIQHEYAENITDKKQQHNDNSSKNREEISTTDSRSVNKQHTSKSRLVAVSKDDFLSSGMDEPVKASSVGTENIISANKDVDSLSDFDSFSDMDKQWEKWEDKDVHNANSVSLSNEEVSEPMLETNRSQNHNDQDYETYDDYAVYYDDDLFDPVSNFMEQVHSEDIDPDMTPPDLCADITVPDGLDDLDELEVPDFSDCETFS